MMILDTTENVQTGRKLKKLNYAGVWEELADVPSQPRKIRVDR